jgi:hypothetical protein
VAGLTLKPEQYMILLSVDMYRKPLILCPSMMLRPSVRTCRFTVRLVANFSALARR